MESPVQKEGYLRQILKTTKGCPITQLYLEVGQVPARFAIQKMRLLFLKYILQQSDESSLKKVLRSCCCCLLPIDVNIIQK